MIWTAVSALLGRIGWRGWVAIGGVLAVTASAVYVRHLRAGLAGAEARAEAAEATARETRAALDAYRADVARQQAAAEALRRRDRARIADLDRAITEVTAHAQDACRLSPGDPLRRAAEWVRDTAGQD